MEKKTLKHLNTEDISPNPHNPRMIFDEQGLSDLKTSVKKVGILVPITVYENTKDVPKSNYILLDGERRWRTSKELGMETIPANVIDEPEDVTQNILFMFNIHHFRNDWALFPTALKLELLMKELGVDSEKVLSEFTGVNRTTIRRCKRLLWYPNKYRTILLEKGGKISTDFFIELYPIAHRLSQEDEYLSSERIIEFVDKMIDKFQNGDTLTDVKDFRQIRKSMAYYEKKEVFDVFLDKTKSFLSNNESDLNDFVPHDFDDEMFIQNLLKYIGYLNESLKELDPDLISDYYILDSMKKLNFNLANVIDQIE